MDADLFQASIEYELLTQSVYQAILAKQDAGTIDVKHNVDLLGRSGVAHQVDVFWEFKQAGVTHRVLIECKNYGTSINLEKARNFFGVLHDIGNCVGIMVTKTGYQSGAREFLKFYGIATKLLREPTKEDWQGRIREVHINIIPRVPVSTAEKPIICNLNVQATSEEQQTRLNAALATNPDLLKFSPTTRFVDHSGTPVDDTLAFWLPKQLNVMKYADGGPYTEVIAISDKFLAADLGEGSELIRVLGVTVIFHVETLAAQKVVINAADTVDAILKDVESGEWEHVHESKP